MMNENVDTKLKRLLSLTKQLLTKLVPHYSSCSDSTRIIDTIDSLLLLILR